MKRLCPICYHCLMVRVVTEGIVRKKTYEIDRVLAQHWAEQDVRGGLDRALELLKKARKAADELDQALERQMETSLPGDVSRELLQLKKELAAAGGLGQLIQQHQDALAAFAAVGQELERYKEILEAAGGIERIWERHQLFMAAAPEFSPLFTIEPGKRSGQPCIRRIRMTIYDVLEYQTSGMTDAEILREFSNLTQEDLDVCRAFGAYMEERFKSLES